MPESSGKPSLLQIFGSVLAAAFGVQSSANRERDFTKGSAKAYIIAGLVFTIAFVFILLTIVKWILR